MSSRRSASPSGSQVPVMAQQGSIDSDDGADSQIKSDVNDDDYEGKGDDPTEEEDELEGEDSDEEAPNQLKYYVEAGCHLKGYPQYSEVDVARLAADKAMFPKWKSESPFDDYDCFGPKIETTYNVVAMLPPYHHGFRKKGNELVKQWSTAKFPERVVSSPLVACHGRVAACRVGEPDVDKRLWVVGVCGSCYINTHVSDCAAEGGHWNNEGVFVWRDGAKEGSIDESLEDFVERSQHLRLGRTIKDLLKHFKIKDPSGANATNAIRIAAEIEEGTYDPDKSVSGTKTEPKAKKDRDAPIKKRESSASLTLKPKKKVNFDPKVAEAGTSKSKSATRPQRDLSTTPAGPSRIPADVPNTATLSAKKVSSGSGSTIAGGKKRKLSESALDTEASESKKSSVTYISKMYKKPTDLSDVKTIKETVAKHSAEGYGVPKYVHELLRYADEYENLLTAHQSYSGAAQTLTRSLQTRVQVLTNQLESQEPDSEPSERRLEALDKLDVAAKEIQAEYDRIARTSQRWKKLYDGSEKQLALVQKEVQKLRDEGEKE